MKNLATLISVASASRVPKAIRVFGYIIVILGITTALTGILVLALGGFVAYACAPTLGAWTASD